jgi:hypothetical protein
VAARIVRSEVQRKKPTARRAACGDSSGIGVAALDQMVENLRKTLVRLRHKIVALLAPMPPTGQPAGVIFSVLFAVTGQVYRHA